MKTAVVRMSSSTSCTRSDFMATTFPTLGVFQALQHRGCSQRSWLLCWVFVELSSPFALLQRDDARRLVAVGVVAAARISDVPTFPYIMLYGSDLPLGGTTRTTRPTRQQDYRLMVVVSLVTPHTHYYHRTNWITRGSAGLWKELSPSHPLNNTLHT